MTIILFIRRHRGTSVTSSRICYVPLVLLKFDTVEFRSKGPGRKGNPPIREIISGPFSHFLIYFHIGYKGISVYGKNWADPMKSLEAKFHCICIYMYCLSIYIYIYIYCISIIEFWAMFVLFNYDLFLLIYSSKNPIIWSEILQRYNQWMF